jgi:uncharacterized protein YndB with AHSA1/START domain
MTKTDTELDRIERSIDIDAPAERVWELISRPGWWINEGEIDPDPQLREEGDAVVLTHPRYGEFRLQTLRSEPPRRATYRWIDGDADAGTLVEFSIEDRAGAGVTLRVVESGFTSLGKDHDAVVRHVEGNTEGWESELALAQRFVSGRA